MVKRIAVAWLLASATSAASAPAWLDPARIAADIQSQGAKVVVDRLWNAPTADRARPTRWDVVIDEIWKGEPDWIALAPKLAPGTDAGTAESLGIGLAHALPVAPAAVLAAFESTSGDAVGIERVCSAPFIEDTVKDVPAYLRAARKAVQRVDSPALALAKAQCLTALGKAGDSTR